ncbi:MAG: polyphosphate kinase 1 [Flavobacteriales bacterium]|nr:polyphosphate kinase 1 [Flavobacteriales bacterium]MCX7767861.1 polyphosphate kinase 1 [Flavobacteriales bacterium]MDW8410476.1 polyphosphate kinase 1 [Flavobacteriales bacterium]
MAKDEVITERYYSANLSWLSFNFRVLQEAMNEDNPLLERVKFLAIFSSNLEEFFRVRVAALRSLSEARKVKNLDFEPAELLKKIKEEVSRQQEIFGHTFRTSILPALQREGIFIRDEAWLLKHHREFCFNYFKEKLRPFVKVQKPGWSERSVFLENGKLYLVFHRPGKGVDTMTLMNVPVEAAGRFIEIHSENGSQERNFCFVDDILRVALCHPLRGRPYAGGYSVKLTRDAELNIEDEFSGSLVKKIRKSLKERAHGAPSRFLYDRRIPVSMLEALQGFLELDPDDLVAGDVYHNFSDFFQFPQIVQRPDLQYPPVERVRVPEVDGAPSLLKYLHKESLLLHYPYMPFDYFLRFLEEAASSKSVSEIKITLYRLARQSKVIDLLLKAAANGKSVTAFFEVKARFDEESNLEYSDILKRAGVKVLYSFPGLKVHAKLCLVVRRKGKQTRRYAYLATGNFNENTATQYTDLALMTTSKKITSEVADLFEMLEDMRKRFEFKHLLISPDHLRYEIYRRIDREIIHHLEGKPAGIFLKMNGLDDPEMIDMLYEASEKGVPIRMVVRGICRLLPGIPDLSSRIEVRSVVDRFLEHNRIYIFENAGNPEYFLSSADFMSRNLSRRIEVAFPITDPRHQRIIRHISEIYWKDNTKARIIDPKHQNNFVLPKPGEEPFNAQAHFWAYYRQLFAPKVQEISSPSN